MPRPENPLDPDSGPVAAFAVALRELRASAGSPSYRTMSKRSYYGFTTLAEAAAGRRFPNWETTRAYVAACGGDVKEWERRWKETAARLNRTGDTGADETGERSPPLRPAVPEQARRAVTATRLEPSPHGSGRDPGMRPFPDDAGAYGQRGGPTIRRIMLGAHLRRLRERRRLTREEAGYTIRATASKISRMELGRVGFKERDVDDLLSLYGVADPDERGHLLNLAREASSPGWWHRYGDVLPSWFETYLGLEEAASIVRTYDIQFVPELLQSEDYARTVVRMGQEDVPEDEVERRVRLRMTRRARLGEPNGPTLWAIVEEAALRRPVGGRRIMLDQIRFLAEVADMPNVTLQIVPFALGARIPVNTPFTILRFGEPDVPDVVYLEQLTSALYLDKPSDLDAYGRVMNNISLSALPPQESVAFLKRLSHNI
ncbi:DUF5753 domain-containing protein [Actinomadura rupiterrae]|uniref:DUF5753 domain-containing protein n=1 Tax=Actinomadura rupiterrae TaxID=559627 RepID=UPI0027E2B078|nr:DUF5753 domain-containing protein [Actinomadura rupiterrae]MCP2339631.1 transcriptional regulator with XRE-family HTH domain [Actinomadura rupiterrae]